MISAFRREVD